MVVNELDLRTPLESLGITCGVFPYRTEAGRFIEYRTYFVWYEKICSVAPELRKNGQPIGWRNMVEGRVSHQCPQSTAIGCIFLGDRMGKLS